MNLSGISNQSILGKALRFPTKFIPSEMKMPILQGKLRGKQWIVGSSQHGCWLGSYEYEKQMIFDQTVKPGDIVFDLGAHVGFYALLASVLVGSKGRVFAFEPLPTNLFYLKEHLRINQIDNIRVLEAAVSDCSGVASFIQNASSFQGCLSAQGQLQVNKVSLDELIAQNEIPLPNYIKMDVEGAEMQVLLGAKSMLADARPSILLATHGQDIQQQCCEFLRSLGYQFKPLGGKNLELADEIFAYYKE